MIWLLGIGVCAVVVWFWFRMIANNDDLWRD